MIAGKRDGIPEALRKIPRWTTWDLRLNPRGKHTKVPEGSTWDPKTCHPYDAVATLPRTPTGGIGFVTTGKIKVGDAYAVALDIDACRHPTTGAIELWARHLIDQSGRSYAEITPSGAGLRLWVLVRREPKPVKIIKIQSPPPEGVTKTPEIQVFGTGPAGYVTVTGEQVPGTSRILEVIDSLEWLLKDYGPTETETPKIELKTTGPKPSLDEIGGAVTKTDAGKALVMAEWAKLNFPSASEAYHELEIQVLRAARNHIDQAAEFLLTRTFFGKGLVESKDPGRYTRKTWVLRDLARAAAHAQKRVDVFAEGLPDDWEPKDYNAPDPGDPWVLQAAKFSRVCAEQNFLFYGLLPARGLAQIFGDPSCGKTPVALSLALHVALGLDFFGHELDTQGPVVYMIGEDSTGIRDRLKAQLMTTDPLHALDRIPFYLTTRPGALIEGRNRDRWIKEIRQAAGVDKIALLVVDTQNRNFGPGNENDTEDMTRFVEEIDALSRALGCLVLLVHHTGHREKGRSRGASVLPAALDAQYEVRRQGHIVTVIPTKAKNWAEPEPLVGALVPVTLGEDQKGRPITAITLQDEAPNDDTAFEALQDPPPFDELRPNEQRIIRALEDAGGEIGGRKETARAAHITVDQARYALDALEKYGLIEAVPRPRPKSTLYRLV